MKVKNIHNLMLAPCFLLFALPVLGKDKFCNSSGIFYCANKEANPDSSKNCGQSPTSAIIQGINYTPVFSGGPGWSYEPWRFMYSIPPTGKQSLYGVAQILVYSDSWRNPNYKPPTINNTAEIIVYNCKLCPSGTALQGDSCVANPAKDPANNGNSCENSTNRPINISTGNKYYHETDYSDSEFLITRSYNSATTRWTFNYRQRLYLHSLANQSLQIGSDGKPYYPHETWALRQDGKVVRFAYHGATEHIYTQRSTQAQLSLQLINPEYNSALTQNQGDIYQRDASGLLLIENNQVTTSVTLGNTHELAIGQTRERYDIRGRLTQIQPPGQPAYEISYLENAVTVTRGNRQLKIVSDARDRVSQVILPDSSVINYLYDSTRPQSDILTSVSRTYLDGSQRILRQYFYENTNFPSHITSIKNEEGDLISSVQYDDQGRAISSEHGPRNSGIDRSLIRYNSNGTRTVTNPLGKETTYSFAQYFGEYKITKIDGHPSSNCVGANRTFTYDANGHLLSNIDWKGFLTTYDYDDRGLEVSRTEASGTAQARTITTEWHPSLFLPLVVTEPDRIIRYQYDDQGRQLARTVETR